VFGFWAKYCHLLIYLVKSLFSSILVLCNLLVKATLFFSLPSSLSPHLPSSHLCQPPMCFGNSHIALSFNPIWVASVWYIVKLPSWGLRVIELLNGSHLCFYVPVQRISTWVYWQPICVPTRGMKLWRYKFLPCFSDFVFWSLLLGSIFLLRF